VAALNIQPSSRSVARQNSRRNLYPCSVRFTTRAIALFALLLSPAVGSAQNTRPTQSQVEAAYLFNFGKFVTWPSNHTPPDSFIICILGKDPFGPVLDATVSGESIGQKKIEIQRIAKFQEASTCNILFISSSEEGHLGSILIAAQKMNLLTVSDMKRFAERGGTIGLVTQQDKIRFEVNRKAAEQCHLIVSSELLKVAVRVVEASAPAD
jgi:hypothetical protein